MMLIFLSFENNIVVPSGKHRKFYKNPLVKQQQRVGQTERVALEHIHYQVQNTVGSRCVSQRAQSVLCDDLEGRDMCKGGSRGRGHMCTYGWFMLLYGEINTTLLSNYLPMKNKELPWWLSGKESACQCRRHGFHP